MVIPRTITKTDNHYGPGVTIQNGVIGSESALHVSRNYSDNSVRTSNDLDMVELFISMTTVRSNGGDEVLTMTLDFEQAVALADTIKENLAFTLDLLGVKDE